MVKRNFYVDVDLNGSQLLCGSIAATLITSTGKRQTVLNGSVNGAGFPNALSIGSGLAVTLTAATTPFELSFATGWNNGAIDYPGRFTSNQSFASLTVSTTCYLYVDRNPTTGTLTTGFSTLAPIYATIAPASPATDQHWFDLNAFLMKRWSGSAWVAYQRVFIGDALTGASAVTNVVSYAYRGFYQSAWLAVTGSTIYNFNHNLGLPCVSGNAMIGVWSSIVGNDSDGIVAIPTLTTVTLGFPTYNGYQAINNNANNRKVFPLFTQPNVALNGSNNWVTSAFYKVTVSRYW